MEHADRQFGQWKSGADFISANTALVVGLGRIGGLGGWDFFRGNASVTSASKQ
jgi:hypothetical protein